MSINDDDLPSDFDATIQEEAERLGLSESKNTDELDKALYTKLAEQNIASRQNDSDEAYKQDGLSKGNGSNETGNGVATEESDESLSESAASTEDRPPNGWKPLSKSKWESLDPVIKAEITKREADFHKGIEEYKEDAGRARRFDQVIQPFLANIQAAGVAPEQAVSNLLSFEHTMRNGSKQQRLTVLQNIAKFYDVDLAGASVGNEEDKPYIDPEVAKLQEQHQALLYREAARERAAQEAQAASLTSMISDFAKSEGHEHFDVLRPMMATFLQTGQAEDLNDAYEKAAWAHPEVRELLIAQQQESRRKAAQAAKAKRGNWINVPRRGVIPGGNPQKSIDEVLREKLAELQLGS